MLANLISLYTPNVAISNVIQTYSGTLTSDAHNFILHVRATLSHTVPLPPHCPTLLPLPPRPTHPALLWCCRRLSRGTTTTM